MLRSITLLGIGLGFVSNAAAETRVAEAAAPQTRIRVAVIPGIAVGLDAAKVDALGQDLAEALASELDIDTVGGLEVRRQLPPQGLPPDCVANPSCAADVARRVGAGQLLFVVMVDTAGRGAVQIDSTWVEPATGKSSARPAIDVPSVTEARPRFAAAARQLLPDAPVRARPGAGMMTQEIPRHITTPVMITAGVSAVGIGVGTLFGLRARSRYRACSDVPCDGDQKSSIRRNSLLADAGFVLAIGGAIATGVLYATSGKEARLVVSPSPGGVALAAVGRF